MLLKSDRAIVLRVTKVAWEAMLNNTLRDPTFRFAHGDVAGLASPQATLLCVRQLSVLREMPLATLRAELSAWCLVILVDRLDDLPGPSLLRRQLQLLHAQQLTVVCVDHLLVGSVGLWNEAIFAH